MVRALTWSSRTADTNTSDSCNKSTYGLEDKLASTEILTVCDKQEGLSPVPVLPGS